MSYYGYFDSGIYRYYATEYLAGDTLRQWRKKNSNPTEHKIREIALYVYLRIHLQSHPVLILI